jgi:hypothetical protein
LYKQAADKLDLVERLFHVKRGNKRAHKVGDIGSRTSEVQRAKLHRVNIINELDFQPINNINPLKISSLSLHQTRYTYSRLLPTVNNNTYTFLKYCQTYSQSWLSKYFNKGILSRVYQRTSLNSGQYQLRYSYI